MRYLFYYSLTLILNFPFQPPSVSTYIYIVYKYLFTIREVEGGFTRVLSKGWRTRSGLVGENNVKSSFVTFDEIRRTNYGLLIVYPGEEGIMPTRPDSYDINPGNCN